ncbi:hypothetical protein KJA17_02065 [Patescibacteria group bacterium]|nr:hypothetical protein [Patescibacteria group bacterium]
MNQESKKTQKLIFPEHVVDIISGLMERYKISENIEEVFAKLRKGEKTRGGEIANILRESGQGKLTEENLPSELQKRLNISKEKAVNLAKDIQDKILSRLEKVSPEPIAPVEKKEIKKKPKEDIYREPTE